MNVSIQYYRHTKDLPTSLMALVADWDYWTDQELYAALDTGNYTLFYAFSGEGCPLGVLLIVETIDSCDIIYLFTAQECRRQNVARRLLMALEDYLQDKGTIHTLFLEVKEQNIPARRLYESFGMSIIGSRHTYYKDGSHAKIYSKQLRREHEIPSK